jgi:hypothetical protein
MTDDQTRDDVAALRRSVFNGAADWLDADTKRGEHCWTADNGDRCYGWRDGEGSVLTIVHADGRLDGLHSSMIDYRTCRWPV